MKYKFVAWKEEGIWTAHSPSVSGVYGVGRTVQAAEADLKDALALLFRYLSESGERRPRSQKLKFGEVRV